ncbi:MAG TPA: DinB family protein [Bryobacteraceae bacterium]|nr:DinB family protein [Bryobacteraceae bacterium]
MTATVPAGISEPAPLSTAQKLSAEELEQGHLFLQQTRNSVIGATKGLSAAQWRFKPSPDRWSIAENLDHIVIVQERVLGPVMERLANAPAPPAGRDYQLVDAIVIHHFPTRLSKFPAPEFVRPLEQIASLELLDRLTANYARLAGCLESIPWLRQHALDAPPLKAVSKGAFEVMDGYQWILAAAAHTERHVKQMLEVMADPDYPA